MNNRLQQGSNTLNKSLYSVPFEICSINTVCNREQDFV